MLIYLGRVFMHFGAVMSVSVRTYECACVHATVASTIALE
jgi:hypothetical protein